MTPLSAAFQNKALAHRGLHDAARGIIENAASAFDAAMAKGYGIELDVQLSSDGHAVVFHDDTLDRVTATCGPVRNKTLNELQNISLKSSSDKINSLAEILARVAGRVPLLIELKDQSGTLGNAPNEHDLALVKAVVRDLERYEGEAAVMSFNPTIVQLLAAHLPNRAVGWTTCDFTPEEWPDVPNDWLAQLAPLTQFDKIGASFTSHDVNDLASSAVQALKTRGIPILCWTVKSPEQAEFARATACSITFEGYLPSTTY
jgi:glycerophosphoryl diester phosphodiesterase